MDPERKGEEGFPPASAAAGDDFSFEAFREWLKKCKGAAGMQQLDSNAEYQLWLAGACPLVEGSVNVAQLSANTGLLAGYRAVNSYALEENARAARAVPLPSLRWPGAPRVVGAHGAACPRPHREQHDR